MPVPTSRPQPPRYNAAQERRRITWLVLLLGLVIVLINEAAKPKNWEWLTGKAPQMAAPPVGSQPLAGATAADEALTPDAVRIVGSVAGPAKTAGIGADLPPALQLPVELLAQVNDAMVGVRRQEAGAYFAALAKARDVPPAAFQAAARTDLTYASLMHDAELHRGEIISLEGELRWFQPMEAGENDHGLTALYEGYLVTEAAGRTNPYRIVCVSKPQGFPLGTEIRERVTFAGYFFKRYSYATAHGMHSAPMLIGPTVGWRPRPSEAVPGRQAPVYWPAAVSAAVLALAWLLWRFRGVARFAGLSRNQKRDAAALPAEIPVVEPEKFLAELRLEESDGAAESTKAG